MKANAKRPVQGPVRTVKKRKDSREDMFMVVPANKVVVPEKERDDNFFANTKSSMISIYSLEQSC